jgi:hypothetical protein
MKLSIQAMLNFGSTGAEKVKALTDRIRENLERSQVSANKIDKGSFAPTASQAAGPGDGRRYRGQRGMIGSRNASGRNFSGMASMLGGEQDEGGGIIAAYATIAANLFAITAGFTALSKAAQTEQLTKGLELMGARAGVALPPVAKNIQNITDNALSYAESMKVVAQATAAGFKTTEIERLASVARGASVALGRDMSDAIDRLTRGTIKLEPELLDELGIMTRLDEAVRIYALANNKAVSSLTQTERRQAFLNAVLAEGEKKFGDISEQIDSNPYDRLVASLKDTGTGFLNLLNTKLVPVVKVLADMPGLAIAPLMFIITSAASKVLPNFGNAWDKVGDKINMFSDRITYNKALIDSYNDSLLESAVNIETAINKGALNGISNTTLNPIDLIGAPTDTGDIRAQLANMDRVIRLKEQEAGFDQTQLQTLRQIRRELGESLAIQQAQASASRRLAEMENKRLVSIKMSNRYEAASVDLSQGNIFGAVGTTLGGLKDDVKNLFTKTPEVAGQRFAQLGAGISNTAKILGSLMSSMTFYIGAAVALGQVLYSLWKGMGTEAEKAVRKAVEGLKDYIENIKETNKQLKLMLQPGKGESSKAFDAYKASLDQVEQKLREVILLKRAAEAGSSGQFSGATRGSVSYEYLADQMGGGQVVEAYTPLNAVLQKQLKVEKEVAEFLVQRIALVETMNKQEAEKLRTVAMTGIELEQVEIQTRKVLESTLNIEATYQSIGDSSKNLGEALDKWIPKDIETPFSKANDAMKDMVSNIKKSGQGYTQVAEQFTISADQMKTILRVSSSLGVLTNTEIAQLTTIYKFKEDLLKIEADLLNLEKERNGTTNPIRLAQLAWEVFLLERKKAATTAKLGKGLIDGTEALETAGDAIKTYEDGLAILEKTVPLQNKRIEQDAELLKINREIVKVQEEGSLAAISAGVSITRDKRLEALIELRNRRRNLANLETENEAKRQTAANELSLAGRRIAYENKLGDYEENATKQLLLKNSEYAEQVEIQTKAVTLAGQAEEKIRAEIQAQQDLINALFDGVAAEQRSLDLNKKKLENAKERLKLENDITAAGRTLENLKTTEKALNQGRSVSEKELKDQQVQGLKDQKDQLLQEAKFAKIEFLAKMAQIELERKVSLRELEYMKELEGPASYAQYDSIIADTNALSNVFKNNTDVDALVDSLTALTPGFSTILESMQVLTDAQAAVIDKQIDLTNRDSSQDLLNQRRTQFQPSLNAAIMPSAMRGYMDSEAQKAGGWSELIKNPAAYETALKLSAELANMDLIGQGLTNTFDAFYNGLGEAFSGILSGTKSVKQAFADLAISVLQSISKMITEMLILKLVSGFMGGFAGLGATGGASGGAATHSVANNARPFANGGIIGLADGGITGRKSLQGIVSKPTYLVGEGKHNEAVVPLPNGRSIPVQMHGGANANNSVQVNVNISNEGSAQTETQGNDAANLGALIAGAVQRELMAQKAPGGLLNRYGAS